MSGRFIKVVIVGPAGVGKTSLRHQYTSGRFATGYRATIGTDFITKTVPHHSQPQPSTSKASSAPSPDPTAAPSSPSTPPTDPVTLQIWDTAGQERFSALSAAFFRGADAVILVYDVNRPETLTELERWWDEFRIKVPIAEGEEANYCVVVVGNKTDLIPTTKRAGKPLAVAAVANPFLRGMIPVPESEGVLEDSDTIGPSSPLDLFSEPPSPTDRRAQPSSLTMARPIAQPLQENPLETLSNPSATPRPRNLESVLKSPSRFGTMTSTRTGVSVYHTPSSSLFDSPFPLPRTAGVSRSTSRSTSSGGHIHHASARDTDDLEMSMDLEHDYRYDVNASSSSMSGYATAKSTPSQSPTSDSESSLEMPDLPTRRLTINSVTSETSLSTVRPQGITAISFRDLPASPIADFTPSLSPTRSRASSASSASPNHNVATTDLPTPSASPPSPPILTASLMATLHQQQQQSLAETQTSGPKKLDVGPKLFFTSAKTMAIRPDEVQLTPVADVFAYVAERVVRRWEWEDSIMELQEYGADSESNEARGRGRSFTVRLGEGWRDLVGGTSRSGTCCAT